MKISHFLRCYRAILSVLVYSLLLGTPSAYAANPNLFASAEDSRFDNYFGGPMVIEVVVIDSDINDTDEAKGEPNVYVNGKTLRMVQGTDGGWYGYFADLTMAQQADSTVGLPGFGLDFGEFCSSDSDIAGIQLTDTDAFAIPRDITSGSNGLEPLGVCGSEPGENDAIVNHVVRHAKEMSSPPRVGHGQIGLHEKLWPLIQLYDLKKSENVAIHYNKGGGVQVINLTFDSSGPSAELEIDRQKYPRNSQVHLTITNFILDIDPTDEDSWTFGTNPSSPMLVYQAFDENGQIDADGTAGAVNINEGNMLHDLMFGDSGVLLFDVDNQDTGTDVVNLADNQDQMILAGDNAAEAMSAGGSFGPGSLPVTVTEQGPNSKVFLSTDEGNSSAVKVSRDALRGTSATLTYNETRKTILTATESATIEILPIDSVWNSGEEIEVRLFDPDLNKNSQADEDLDVYNPNVQRIPALQTGNPFTLRNLASAELDGIELFIKDVQPCSLRAMLVNSGDDQLLQDGSRLVLTMKDTFADLYQSINDPAGQFSGFNFFNYDVRSFEESLTGRSVAAVDVHITDGQKTTSFMNAGDQALLNLEDADGNSIFTMTPTAPVTMVFTFHANEDQVIQEGTVLPIVCDFFSFGRINDGTSSSERISNQIIRFELEETSDNTSIFEGTLEFTMLNQLNMLEPRTYDFRTIVDDPNFIVQEGLQGIDAPTVFYFDIDESGSVAIVSDHQATPSHSGTVSLESDTYRIGETVFVTLADQDLNSNSDLLEVYTTVSPSADLDPASDTVGKKGLGNYTTNSLGAFGRLVEITFNGERWRSGLTENGGACGAADVPDDGLSEATVSLVETERNTGIFIGSFDIPEFYCSSKSGQLESTIGAQVGVQYVDYLTADNRLKVVSDSAEIRTTSGVISLDRAAYPVPFGSVNDFFPGENQTDQTSPDGDSIFPIHHRGVIADGDRNIDANTEEIGPGDLLIHVRVNDPDLDRSGSGIDTIAQGEYGPVKIMISRGNTTLLLATAGGIASKPGVITSGNEVIPGITRELGPIKEFSPDSAIFEIDLRMRYTDGPASTLGPVTPDNGYLSLTGNSGVLGRFDQEPENGSYCILEGDVISVEYRDSNDASGNPNLTSDTAFFHLHTGKLKSDQLDVTIGSKMVLTLIDEDLNLDSRRIEEYDIDLLEWSSLAGSFTLGDLGGRTDRFNPIPFRIRETGKNHGRFTVNLTIPFDLNGLRVVDNETVTLAYSDWGGSSGRYVGRLAENSKVSFTTTLPPVSASFTSAGSRTLPEGTDEDHRIPIKLFVPYGDAITEDIIVRVVDEGTGSALVDSDYRGFDATPITFPSGSHGGDIRELILSILHDVRREGDESINLRLESIQGPAILGDILSHQVLITDDERDNPANAKLFVSAQNRQFNHHMSGPMVIEVVVIDSNINDTDEAKGEPEVTVNGKALRMVQAVDGNWYGYFADRIMAQTADATVGKPGFGLDFGKFCKPDSDIIGIDLQETTGFAIPRDIDSASNGFEPIGVCGSSIKPEHRLVNHVVREAKEVNTSNIPDAGQIGIDVDAWPFIQLYDLTPGGDVIIRYRRGGGDQTTTLEFDSVGLFSKLQTHRTVYPPHSHVSLTLADMALNIDPTDEDSWTFGTNSSSPMIVYQAFDESGQIDADGTAGAVNINVRDQLRDLMFGDNGVLTLDVNVKNAGVDVVNLFDNKNQQINPGNRASDAVSAGGSFGAGTLPITLTEQGPNSGVFTSYDEEDESNIKTTGNMGMGNFATVEYNDTQASIFSSFSDASLDIQLIDEEWNSGEKIPVVLIDADANMNSHADEDLDVWNPNVDEIPALQMGNPFTLEHLESARLAGVDLVLDEVQPVSQRAMLRIPSGDHKIPDESTLVLTLRDTYADLFKSINAPSESFLGFNFFNFDIRSFARAIDMDSIDVDITDGQSILRLVEKKSISRIRESKGLINLNKAVGDKMFGMDMNAKVTLIFTFKLEDSQIIPGKTILPIVCDFFSFGKINDGTKPEERINNMIVRLELEETGDNTSVFAGSLEFTMLNQLNILDPEIYQGLKTIADDPTFIVTGRLLNGNAPKVVYRDRNTDGAFTSISDQQDVTTHSGMASFDTESYKIGDAVYVTLKDPDLNLDSNLLEIYTAVNSSTDPAEHTVGEAGLGKYTTNSLGAFGRLLEITFNGERWKSGITENGGACGEAGVPDDGLVDAAFSMVETDVGTGVFVGSFEIPETFCNSSTGTVESLIGAKIGVHYVDYLNGDNRLEEVSSFAEINTSKDLGIAPFVNPDIDPQTYVDRYFNEPAFKEWFDQNYPDYTSIYQAVGLEEPSHDDTNEIRVTTNKATYSQGETVDISGQISGTLVPSTEVKIEVLVQNSLIHANNIAPDPDGRFTFSVVAEGPDWISSGIYTIRANYGAQLFTESTFHLGSAETSFNAVTDKASYFRGENIKLSGSGATGNLFPIHAATIILRNPSERIIMIDQLESNDDGAFSNNFLADGPLWTDTGEYRLSVHFGDQFEIITFSFDSIPHSPETVYVKHDALGTPDGTSWINAFTNLQDALAAVNFGDEIWVAAGIYTPDKGGSMTPGDRKASFFLRNGVRAYGGFKGSETERDQRDFKANVTFLSGDLLKNDDDSSDRLADNCFHVVSSHASSSLTILDGFTISGGNANAEVIHQLDSKGGGILVSLGSPVISNCRIIGNKANSLGGGIAIINSGNPIFRSCEIVDNSVLGDGGGVGILSASPNFVGCKFIGNSANGNGGGLNGQLYNLPSLTKSTFVGNTAGGDGGALFIGINGGGEITNCTFFRNHALNSGGGAKIFLMLEDVAAVPSPPDSFNNGLAGNTQSAQKQVSIRNSIFWNNTATINHQIAGTPNVSYSIIEGNFKGLGNIDQDPLFVDNDGNDNSVGTIDDNLKLLTGSPAIDAGNNEAVINLNPDDVQIDLDGNPRFIDDPDTVDTGLGTPPIVDMGAYEFVPVPGLIGHWKMDEEKWNGSADEVVDSTGQENHGVSQSGARILAEGKLNRAGEFDGDDDYVDLGKIALQDPFQLITGGTITAWFKQREGGDRWQAIVDKSDGPGGANGYSLVVDGVDRSLLILVNGSNYRTGINAFELDEWTHVAAVIGADDFEIYINGQELAGSFNTGVAQLPPNAETEMRLGGWNHADAQTLNGVLDDLRIYTKRLTKTDITMLTAEANGGLIGYWSFDEGDGCVANDIASGSNGMLKPDCPVNSPQRVVGQDSGALLFDGKDDYFDGGNAPQLNFGADQSFTITVQARDDQANGRNTWGPIVQKSQSRLMWSNSHAGYGISRFGGAQNKFMFAISDGTTSKRIASPKMNSGFHSLALVVNREHQRMKAYVDGQQVGRTLDISMVASLDVVNPLRIGRNGFKSFKGTVDEVKIYTRVLGVFAVDDLGQTVVNEEVNLDVIANDTNDLGNLDKVSVTVVSRPENGRIIRIVNGVITYRPNAGFIGTDYFRYAVADVENVSSNSASVMVTVADESALIAHYPFETEIDGLTPEMVGVLDVKSRDGIVRGLAKAPLNGFSGLGRAYEFDGVNDFIEVDQRANLDFGEQQSFSVTVWARDDKPSGNNTWGPIVQKGARDLLWRNGRKGYGISRYASRRNGFIFGISDGIKPRVVVVSRINPDGVHFLALVVDRESTPQQMRAYVDGKLVGKRDISGLGSLVANYPLRIGWNGFKYFDGLIDDVKIYCRPLSGAEIATEFVDTTSTTAATSSVLIVKNSLSFGERLPLTDSMISYTIYEDADDGTIDGWQAYGEGNVLNVEDSSGNRIISTDAHLFGDPFRLGLADLSDWNNTKEFTAYFSILMEENVAVYFRVDTSEGEKNLCYTPGVEMMTVNDGVICFGLGIEPDGQWHEITRNLDNDLGQAIPNASLVSVKDFYVFGSVKLDDLMLIKKNDKK